MNKKVKRDRQANLEKDLLINPSKQQLKKKQQWIRRVVIGCLGILCIIAIFLLSFTIISAIGKSNLTSRAESISPELNQNKRSEKPTVTEKETWQEGWIKYKGQVYAYNHDVLTFLFMGIDKRDGVNQAKSGTDGGQADALFLLVLNPREKSIEVIGINRNTMTEIDIYNESGSYMTTETAQIAVQHGFGNGLEESCDYQIKAVRNLFYNIPIHGYCAVNMNAIASVTDLIGGVELTAIEDVKEVDKNRSNSSYVIRKYETKQLDGKMAYSYVRYRNMDVMGSADMRLKRQQQFLGKLIENTKTATKKDISMPVKLYNAIQKQMVTNVTVDEVAYLATTVVNYQFDNSQFYSIKGETVMGEEFEEYYIDETSLYEMILDIFYDPVEDEGEKRNATQEDASN